MVAAPGCRVQRRSSANMLTAWSLVLLSCSCTHHMLTVGTGSSSNRAPHGFVTVLEGQLASTTPSGFS